MIPFLLNVTGTSILATEVDASGDVAKTVLNGDSVVSVLSSIIVFRKLFN